MTRHPSMRTHVTSLLRVAALAALLLAILAGIAGWWLMDHTEHEPARDIDASQPVATTSEKITNGLHPQTPSASVAGTDAKLADSGPLAASVTVSGTNINGGKQTAVTVTHANPPTVPFVPSPATLNVPTIAQPANAQMGSAVGRTPASARPANVVGAPNSNLAAPAPPPFIAPTPQQMRDQPAATTAAQILSQRLDPKDKPLQAEVARLLEQTYAIRRKAAVERATRLGIPIQGSKAGGGSFSLQDFDAKGEPVYQATDNVNAAISTAVHEVREAVEFDFVDGYSMTVGVWDEPGLRETHREFDDGFGNVRVAVQDFSASVNGSGAHATHVVGTIAALGVDPRLKGMAPLVSVRFWDYDQDISDMNREGSALPDDDKLLVGNGSYGNLMGWAQNTAGDWFWNGIFSNDGNSANDVEDNFGQYNASAAALDGLAFNKPYFLMVRSAGNERDNGPPPEGATFTHAATGQAWVWSAATGGPIGDGHHKQGYDTLGAEKTAKNILTIGAVTDAVTGGNRDVAAATTTDFSSWGPADDGRIKPDVVANGQDVISAGFTSDTASDTMSGTSMASPNAAGSAILLQQYYMEQVGDPMRAATLKGLIIHTADNLGPIGPDYKYGWGLMNTKAAGELVQAHVEEQDGGAIIEDKLNLNVPKTFTFAWDGTKPLRATLCWTDPPGPVQIGHDDPNADLINDLDITVTGPGGAVKLPYVMPYATGAGNQVAVAIQAANHFDNVEQVFVPLVDVVPGVYTVTINHTGNLTYNEQDFSLIISGNKPPPEITLTSSNAPGQLLRDEVDSVHFGLVAEGEESTVTMTVRNEGGIELSNLAVSVDGAVASAFTFSPLTVTTLEPDDETTFTVTYRQPVDNPGSHRATLHVTSNDPVTPSLDVDLVGMSEFHNLVLDWEKPFGSNSAAWTPDGNVVFGNWWDWFETQDFTVRKCDPADGSTIWEKISYGWEPPFADPRPDSMSVLVDANGDVLAAGTSDGVPNQFIGGYHGDIYIVKYAGGNGAKLWDQRWDSPSNYTDTVLSGLVLDADGNIIITINTTEALIDARTIYFKTLITKYAAASGAILWERVLGGGASHAAPCVDPNGDVIITGNTIRKLRGTTGATLWENPATHSMAVVDANGDVIASGGGSSSTSEAILTKYAGATGAVIWQTVHTEPGLWYGGRLVLDPNGDVVASGVLEPAPDRREPCISKFSGATGVRMWEQRLDTGADSYVWSLTLAPDDSVVVTGADYNTVGGFMLSYANADGALRWQKFEGNDFVPFVILHGEEGRMLATGAGGTRMYILENVAPAIAAISSQVTVNEGQDATNSGTFSDSNSNESVTITATRNNQPFGTITKDDEFGTWNWTYPSKKGPEDGGTVVITADDGVAPPVSINFPLTVNNVLPAINAGPDVTLTPAQAGSFSRGLSFIDPGEDTWQATVDYGDGSGTVPLVVDQEAKSFSLVHAFTGPGPFTVTVEIMDGHGTSVDSFFVALERRIDAWRMTHFSTTDNTGDAANDADPDRDGLKNLVEFAFNLNPKQGGTGQLPQPSFGGGGSGLAAQSNAPQGQATGSTFGFTFTEPPGTTGIIYGAEYAASLTGPWLPITDTGTGGAHVFNAPIGANTRLFVRLKVTTNP